MIFKAERWEDDEMIITKHGKPIGGTVTKENGQVIVAWLNTCKELTNDI